ncbi:hypothetical protein [Hymenobacter volaticus]|uniref:Uncharacterized protein n=1 Tax=Hymenobacter volaticus TaxID=2932254 RepID=A0ABY4GCP7_9BACT|nr:hypothetical protein [Hymenobacter volaticus]UOQ68542.1 hypothetical protein MUN86_12025 [Hymenobacter volaticus]
MGYNYVSRPEYTRTNLEGTFDYIWQRTPYHQLVFTPFDLSLVDAIKVDEDFLSSLRTQFPDNPSVLVAFQRQFIPSFSFTSLYNSNDFNETRNAVYFRWFVELGGITRPCTKKLLGAFRFMIFTSLTPILGAIISSGQDRFLCTALMAA